MNEKLNINEYRKKQKKKQWSSRIILVLTVAVLVALGLFVWKMLNSGADAGSDTSGFPVALAGDPVYQSMEMGSYLAVLTDKEVNFYSGKGEKVRSVPHSDSNPAISVSGQRLLLYDAEGTSFSVESTSSTLLTKWTDQKIFLGAIADNGNIAVVTQDERYTCRLTVYNSKGDEIYRWNSASDLITSLDFIGGGTGCLITTIGAKDGFSVGAVYELNFSQTTEKFRTEISDVLPIATQYTGGLIHVVCNDRLVILDDKGSKQREIPFAMNLKQAVNASGKYTVLLFGEDARFNSSVIVYDKNGNVVGQTDSTERIRRIASDGQHVLFLTDSEVICCNMEMQQTAEFTNKQSATDLVCSGAGGYDISPAQLNKFALQ